jgi:hypothetical protein
MVTRERYSVPTIIACVAAMTVIGLIVVGAWLRKCSMQRKP